MNAKFSRAADAAFKKKNREAVLSENERKRLAVREKSVRLRELRLAKESVDREAAALVSAAKAKR